MSTDTYNLRPAADAVIADIADYICSFGRESPLAVDTAYTAILDSVGCAMLALDQPECVRHISPVAPGAVLSPGARVPGTAYELDPVHAAFCTTAMIRWLDYNDTWLAAEWGHPSDNLGAVLALADYLNRTAGEGLTMQDVARRLVQAYEVQGVLALENSFNRHGLDHVLLVRVASAAVAAGMLGTGRDGVISAVSNAWADGGSLRVYRQAPNTGPRKSWAAADAASRAVRLGLLAAAGEPPYPSVLTAPGWGFQDVLLDGHEVTLARPLGSYVMENILFKVAFPAEFHAQTAAECAFALHPQVAHRWDDIERVVIHTQESAIRIISKTGPLYNPADRDHCLQYIVALGLLYGTITPEHYTDRAAADARIDMLRSKMVVLEDERYSREYLDPDKRSIANSVQVRFSDGRATQQVEVEYPLGHRRRRGEALPLLRAKLEAGLRSRYPEGQVERILEAGSDRERLGRMPVDKFLDLLVLP